LNDDENLSITFPYDSTFLGNEIAIKTLPKKKSIPI
jgi:hypothetical protein